MKIKLGKVVLLITLTIVCFNDLFGQRVLTPIRSTYLVSTPVLLDRSGEIGDLEMINVEFPDTVSVGQTVLVSGWIANNGTQVFDADINLNFGFESSEFDVENADIDAIDYIVENEPLNNVFLFPGESLFFTKPVVVDPAKVSANTSNIVIVWPTFKTAPTATTASNQNNVSFAPFFSLGLTLGDPHEGYDQDGGKSANNFTQSNLRVSNQNVVNGNSKDFNTYTDLKQYVLNNDFEIEQCKIYSIDGILLYHSNNNNFSFDRLESISKNKNTFFIVSMRVKNFVENKQLTLKTKYLF